MTKGASGNGGAFFMNDIVGVTTKSKREHGLLLARRASVTLGSLR